jgi:hypothetical protein
MAAEIELLGVSMALESCPDAVPTAWTMLDKSDAMMNSDRIDTAALCWSDTAGPVDNGDNVQDEEFFFFFLGEEELGSRFEACDQVRMLL